MRKKIFSVALATALATTMLAGCTGSGSNNTANTSGDKETKEKVKLTLGIWPSDDLADDIKMFEGYQETYEKSHENVEVVPAHYTYATDTFVSLAESGNCPVIFESWFTEPQKLIRQGLVADITEQVKARGWDTQMNERGLKVLSDADGKIYGIPRDMYALGLMCNVELFEEAGLVENGVPKFPQTMEELAETAKTIKEKTGAAGLCLLAKDNSGGWHFSNIAWNFGADLCKDNGDGTYTSNLNSDEAIKAMEYIYSLKWDYDVLTADPTAEDWGTGFQQLGTGGAAMYIAANDAVAQPTQVNGLATDKLAMCAIPAGPNGDQYALTGGTPYMFSKDATAEEIDAALDWLEVMGKTPVVNDTVKAGLKANAANRVENGVPVLKTFSTWTNQEYIDADAAVVEEYKNVDDALYNDYFDTVSDAAHLREEEEGDAQEMYAQLTSVLQEVITNKDCNIKELMDQANTNYQTILDQKFTK